MESLLIKFYRALVCVFFVFSAMSVPAKNVSAISHCYSTDSIYGEIVCNNKNLAGYYTTYQPKRSKVKANKVRPRGYTATPVFPVIYAQLWLTKEGTFTYTDYTRSDISILTTGTWYKDGDLLYLCGIKPEPASLYEARNCYDWISYSRPLVITTDTITLSLTTSQPSTKNTNECVKLYKLEKGHTGQLNIEEPFPFIWSKRQQAVRDLKESMARCDSLDFVKIHKKNKYANKGVNELLRYYAIALRRPDILKYLMNYSILDPYQDCEPPYKYAFRCYNYPSPYDPEVTDRKNLKDRESEILDITRRKMTYPLTDEEVDSIECHFRDNDYNYINNGYGADIRFQWMLF